LDAGNDVGCGDRMGQIFSQILDGFVMIGIWDVIDILLISIIIYYLPNALLGNQTVNK
jgi:hypothetical protein